MTPSLRQLFVDLLCLTIGGIAVLAYQDASARTTREELRAKRHAIEIVYEACVNSCRVSCAKEPK